MSQKRNLPSWMSTRDTEDSPCNSNSKKPKEDSKEEQNSGNAPESSSKTVDFSKLMEGVVFVLSGFVNPERSTLRSQALAMGATYQPDWNADTTLLICAFPNTPKFRQVERDSGTIVSKEWISQCYTQKKLVDIEEYLMHAGKPWRKTGALAIREKKELPSRQSEKQIDKKPEPLSRKPEKQVDKKPEPLSRKPEKQVDKKQETSGTTSASSKSKSVGNSVKEPVSVTEVKKWAREDLTQTLSWLESQEEKPEPGEIKRIAAEGVLTCLQDAIDSLEQNQDIGSVTELWSFVPRVVKELGKIESSSKKENTTSKKELCKQAKAWKHIYEAELAKPDKGESSGTKSKGASGYESDETIEMNEEEIELAYRNVLQSV